MPVTPPRIPRKPDASKSRVQQRERNARGLCSHCGARKLPGDDRCYRHLFLRKLVAAGIRSVGMSPQDVFKRESLITKAAMRYNSIRLGFMKPAGGVDEKMLRADVLRLVTDAGLFQKRADRRPSLVWGGCHGYRKVLDIIRRFDRRAFKEFQSVKTAG